MFGAAAVSPHDVDSAVAETRRAVAELGMKAIFIRPNIHNGRPWHDRYYDPLWAVCQELNVPVGFHETTGSRMKAAGTDRFKTMGIAHISTHPMEQMLACMDLIMGGDIGALPASALCAFSKDNAAGCRSGCTAWTSTTNGASRSARWRICRCRRRNISAGNGSARSSATRNSSPMSSTAIGDDNLVTTTDYPHGDSKYPNAMDLFLGAEARRRTASARSCGTTRAASMRCEAR